MVRAGDTLTNPATGQTLRFLRTAADTAGALLEIDATWAPRGTEPPEHYHPRQAERFTVLAGALRVPVAGAARELHAGDTLDLPAGVPHSMWNAGDAPAVARWETRPALGTRMPAQQRSVVVLPAPLGPTRPSTSPAAAANDTPRTASWPS